MLSCTMWAAASPLSVSVAHAQYYTWGGTGSTTATTDYNLGTNWSNPPAGAPPVTNGQGAIFDATGSTLIGVTSPVTPYSWSFFATSQSYTVTGSDINFGSEPWGIFNLANLGQTILISNNIGQSPAGVQVKQLGASTLTLSGNNTYSGETTISAGTLQVTNSSSVGTGAVTLDGGTFRANGLSNLTFTNGFNVNTTGGVVDNNGTLLTLSGVVANGNGGSGVLQLADSSGGFGTTVLSGINTYSGGTKVTGTTVQVANNNSIGTGTVTLENGQFQAGSANLIFGNNFKINDTPAGSAIDANGYALTIAGNITDGSGGAGKLTIVDSFGGGSVILTGANTYTGGTTICACGTLQLGTLATTGSIIGDITNEGRFNIVNANTAGITSITTDGGFTSFFGGNTAGTATLVNKNGGTTVFLQASSAGSANITNRTGGVTQFGMPAGTGTSTAGNAAITNNFHGETDFNAFSTAGNAIITTNSGGATYFYDNSTGGNGQFITNGTGFVDFSVSAGRGVAARITAGSIAGSGTYYVGPGSTLVIGSNNLSTEVSGLIADDPCSCRPAGSGALEKVGIGTMTLSGTNTYTGTTTVNGGVLDVEGSIASSILTTVNANAALTGAGTVGNMAIANGGIFLPGNGPGTFMNIAGNLAFQSGALYLVSLNSTSSTFANVTGTASLNGAAGAAFLPGNYVAKRYTILSAAGGINGTFTSFAAVGVPSGLQATLSYDANDAYLNLALSFGVPGSLNANQKNVGDALTNFFDTNGGIPAVFGSLTPAGLSQISGETAVGTQQATFNAMNLFLGLLTDPFIDGRGVSSPSAGGAMPFAGEGDTASAYAAKKSNSAGDAFARIPTKADAARNNLLDPHWSVWGLAFGGGGTTDGNAAVGSNSDTARAFGFAAGADYRISPATLAGFALAGGGTNFSVNGFGTGRSDLFQAGAFVRHNAGAAYVSAALAYGWQDVTTDRTVTVAGVDRLHAEFNANAWSGRVEGGYRFVTQWMGVTPYAAGQFTTYSLPAYAEQALSGAGTFALSYAAKEVTASRTELGLRTDRSFAVPNAILTLRGRVAWAHDFNTDRNISAVFQTLPGAAFVVNGAAQAHDSALATASAEMKWLNGFSLSATFEGEFSDVTRSYAGKGIARYTW